MTLGIIYLGKYFMCTWKIFVFCSSCMKYLIKTVRSHWLAVIFSSLSLLIFCPIYFQREVLKSITIILHFFFYFCLHELCFMYFEAVVRDIYVQHYWVFLVSWHFSINFPFYLWHFFLKLIYEFVLWSSLYLSSI